MIGEKLTQLRKSHGMSQHELARSLKLSDKAIKNWESDISDPNAQNIVALCRIFHITSDELLGINDDVVSLGKLNNDEKFIFRAITQAYMDAVHRIDSSE